MKMTDCKNIKAKLAQEGNILSSMTVEEIQPRLNSQPEGPGEDLFDLIARIQTSRMNDQRYEFPSIKVHKSQAPRKVKEARPKSNTYLKPETPVVKVSSKSTENLIEMLAKAQGNRMEEQRCALPELPGLSAEVRERLIGRNPQPPPDDSFLDMLMRCQAARINDQRCDFPSVPRGPTVPDEDFFNLIARLQSNRLDAQRVSFEEARKHSV